MATVRVGAVHALQDSIAPTQIAFQRGWPQASVAHVLDGSLYLDRSAGTADAIEIATRIERLITHSAATGSQGILFTGSFFAEAVRLARPKVAVPVMTSFDGLLERAMQIDEPMRILSTAPDSVTLLAGELDAMAATRGRTLSVRTEVVPGAMDALVGGDLDRHDELVVAAIDSVAAEEVVVLAQFSMERVIERYDDRPMSVIGPAQQGVAHLHSILS